MKPFKLFLAITLGSLGMAAQADTFKIDPVESSVVFSIMSLGVSNFHGRFNDISGTVFWIRRIPQRARSTSPYLSRAWTPKTKNVISTSRARIFSMLRFANARSSPSDLDSAICLEAPFEA